MCDKCQKKLTALAMIQEAGKMLGLEQMGIGVRRSVVMEQTDGVDPHTPFIEMIALKPLGGKMPDDLVIMDFDPSQLIGGEMKVITMAHSGQDPRPQGERGINSTWVHYDKPPTP